MKLDMDTRKAVPTYAFIGFYVTKREALDALSEYHRNPYDLSHNQTTFAELYESWAERHYPTLKDTGPYHSGYKILEPIKDTRLIDLTYGMVQTCFDKSNKNTPMLSFAKIIVTAVFKEAAKSNIVSTEMYEKMKLLDIKKENPNARPHKRIEAWDLRMIWDHQDDPVAKFVLILCYTGCRISEVLNLTPDRIHLKERYFDIDDAKTPSGIREVPIAEKIVPFFEYFLKQQGKTLIGISYDSYMKRKWKPFMESLKLDYLPHDCRVTCISLLTEAEVDARIIKSIVGHKGSDVTEKVYTRISLPKKLDAINQI